MTHFDLLQTLLASLFTSPSELRIYLRRDTLTAPLVDQLPDDPASKTSVTSAAALLLESKGLSTQLLQRLAQDPSYQGRRADILRAQQQLQALPPSSPPSPGAGAQVIHNQGARIDQQINIVGNPALHFHRDKP